MFTVEITWPGNWHILATGATRDDAEANVLAKIRSARVRPLCPQGRRAMAKYVETAVDAYGAPFIRQQWVEEWKLGAESKRAKR